jgi:hypothetical protein
MTRGALYKPIKLVAIVIANINAAPGRSIENIALQSRAHRAPLAPREDRAAANRSEAHTRPQ